MSGARGKDRPPYTLHVWAMGQGEFTEGQIVPGLYLRIDPQDSEHGLVEPDRIMSLEEYRQLLDNTREQWKIDET